MARMSTVTAALAEKVFIATISAHYRHGLGPGLKLNLKQVAGESVEAALTFNQLIRDEEQNGSVTAVMDANNAFAQGFVCGVSGDSVEALCSARPELEESYIRGWKAGDMKAHDDRTKAN